MSWSVIDISSYQHPNGVPIDYAAVARSGVKAVIAELKDEAGGVNSFFSDDLMGFRGVGLGFGGYLFGRPNVSVAEHVADLESILRIGPAWLDVELAGETAAWAAEILTRTSTVESGYSTRASAYVPPYMGFGPLGPWPWSVGTASDGRVRQLGTGTVPGIEGAVDIDVFEGTWDQLASCFRMPCTKPLRPVPSAKVVGMVGCSTGGYWLAGDNGEVCNFGSAPFLGSLEGKKLASPIVGISAAGPRGYWLVDERGGVWPFGSASFEGSVHGMLGLTKGPGS